MILPLIDLLSWSKRVEIPLNGFRVSNFCVTQLLGDSLLYKYKIELTAISIEEKEKK